MKTQCFTLIILFFSSYLMGVFQNVKFNLLKILYLFAKPPLHSAPVAVFLFGAMHHLQLLLLSWLQVLPGVTGVPLLPCVFAPLSMQKGISDISGNAFQNAMQSMRPTRLVFVASVHFPVSLNLSYQAMRSIQLMPGCLHLQSPAERCGDSCNAPLGWVL